MTLETVNGKRKRISHFRQSHEEKKMSPDHETKLILKVADNRGRVLWHCSETKRKCRQRTEEIR